MSSCSGNIQYASKTTANEVGFAANFQSLINLHRYSNIIQGKYDIPTPFTLSYISSLLSQSASETETGYLPYVNLRIAGTRGRNVTAIKRLIIRFVNSDKVNQTRFM